MSQFYCSFHSNGAKVDKLKCYRITDESLILKLMYTFQNLQHSQEQPQRYFHFIKHLLIITTWYTINFNLW